MSTNFKKAIESSGSVGIVGAKNGYYFTNNILNLDYNYTYNPGTMGYFSRIYYANGEYYLAWTKLKGNPNNDDNMVCTFDGTQFSTSVVGRAGGENDVDGHAVASLGIDNNGYIYMARTESDTTNNLIISRSDNPYDITSFSVFQTFTGEGGHIYPYFAKIDNDLFLIVRGASDSLFAVYKKGLTDETFAALYNIIQINTTDDKSYKSVCRTEIEDEIGMFVMWRDTTTTSRPYRRLGFIKTTDGVTWGNVDASWSKNVVASGYITVAELITNCIIENSLTEEDDHFFCFDSFRVGNIYYGLVEEGKAAGVVYNINISSINIRYYDGSIWQKKVIPASITNAPYTRSYADKVLFHLTHDGTQFILFVLSTDYKTITKYTSVDLDIWSSGQTIYKNGTYGYGLRGSCINKFDLMSVGFDNGVDFANLGTFKY
jgi:hypothetical protein